VIGAMETGPATTCSTAMSFTKLTSMCGTPRCQASTVYVVGTLVPRAPDVKPANKGLLLIARVESDGAAPSPISTSNDESIDPVGRSRQHAARGPDRRRQ